MISTLEAALLSLVHTLPLELFVFVASFIEEVFAPIPSLAVLLITGSFAEVQGRTFLALIPLAIIASLGKTIGAVIVYFFADKIGERVVTKFGRYFGITHEAIKSFGNKITGSPRDYVLLSFFRALPILPSAVVSIGGGLLKIPLRVFVVSTFLGSIVRDSVFLYVGYTGTQLWSTLATNSASIESIVQGIIFIIVFSSLTYLYFKRKRIAKEIS